MTDDEFTGPNLYEMPPCLELIQPSIVSVV